MLFGAETWVLTPRMEWALDSFQHRVVWRLTGRQPAAPPPRRALNGRHPATAQCARGAERKRRWPAEADLRESLERAFEEYREPLENVRAFRYLGQVLTAGDDDWLAVVGNLGRARKPSPSSPSDPPLLAAAYFALLPWRSDLWQDACRSVPSGGPACRIGCTVGGGGFTPPE